MRLLPGLPRRPTTPLLLQFVLLTAGVVVAFVIVRERWKVGRGTGEVQDDPDYPSSLFGLNGREARLADRVRDMEDQNSRLRHQLSLSQNQLMAYLSDKNEGKDGEGQEEDRDNSLPCKNQEHHLPKCEVLHIALVSAGYNTSRSVATLVKSLLFYRQNPIHLHFVADNISTLILSKLFETWKIVQVNVSFYYADAVEDEVSWVPNKHYSGIYGLLKLTLPTVLPKSLRKVIVLDTDITLASDIAQLWALFQTFSSEAALGLVENQSDWYIPGRLWKSHQPWPALGRGFNTGVILMHLDKLRNRKWRQLWRSTAEKDLVTQLSASLADQDVFNAVIKQHPELVHTLPCQWNLQLSDNTRAELCYSANGGGIRAIHAIHWNSPSKLNVKNKDVEYFRNHFLTFQQYDGNLLRRDVIQCSGDGKQQREEEEELEGEELEEEDGDNSCFDLRQARKTVYRTHLFFLDYSYSLPSDNGTAENDITLVAQLSLDRLHMIESLCQQWAGPLSLALYLSDAEAHQFVTFAQSSDVLRGRQNVGYHVVYKEGSFYPVNYLRNVALSSVRTGYVFLSDIDFLPGVDAYSSLRKSVLSLLSHQSEGQKTALVVPAFETYRYRLSAFPRSKAEVLNLLDLGTLLTFRYDVWSQGHRATNYGRWRTATKPYKVNWEQDFEPYVVVRSNVTRFDQRFVGFGWNKVSHLMTLRAQGYQFVVLPNVFIVHMPHAPSLDIARFRASDQYRRCLQLLKEEFVEELSEQYSKEFVS